MSQLLLDKENFYFAPESAIFDVQRAINFSFYSEFSSLSKR